MKRVLFAALFLAAALGTAQAQSDIFVLTSDFSTGSTAFLPAGGSEAQINILGVHSDAVGHYDNGRIYIINRFGQDNILVLDAADLSTPLTQFSVGNGSNPHDIEIVAPDKAYVTRYGTSELLVVDPRDGTELARIDLSAFADADGLPEVSQIVRVGGRVYLSCQRLDRNGAWGPVDDSFLIVVDIASDSLVDVDPDVEGVQGIVLSAPNPNSLAVIGDHIVVGVISSFGDREGGVDVIDTKSNRSLGLAVSESELGGDINSLVMINGEVGYAVISDENFVNSVRSFNLRTVEVGAPLQGISGGFVANLAVDGSRLIVADQGSFSDPNSAGIKIYDAVEGTLLAGPIVTGLPPVSIVVLSDMAVPTAVATEAARPQQAGLGRAYPNPFNATVLIPFAVQGDATAELVVYDALGRKVRTLHSGAVPAGARALSWDGRDSAGQTVGNGAYFVRLQVGQRRETAKIMLLK